MLRRLLFSLAALACAASLAFAAGPDVLPEGKRPQDARLAPPKDLDGYFPFTPYSNPDEWNRRAEWLKRQVLVSQGVFPLPTKTPLNAVVHGKVDRGEYTVERAYFESMPGFFVTGSLYRPVGKPGKHPVVLCPHGHWNEGRFHDAGRDAVRQQIVNGAERFEDSGRSPLQARCVQLARMGCVVFHYDMLGYADSTQLSFELAHRYGLGNLVTRPAMENAEAWGLFSPQAESRLQSIMGLQTWNSIRALDFVETLPDVDTSRIGVTGASGGGTQTFLLAAVDPRVTVAVPAVMVSTSMQGGCTCENACLLRVGTGNVELAALFAPKPLMCLSADDWTKEMPTKGFPDLQQHYKMMGAEKNVFHRPLLHFGHNYNYVSRAAMYSWFNKHFKLGLPEPIVEEDYKRLTRDEMTVWDAEHPKPEGGDAFEKKLLQWYDKDSQQQLAALAGKPAYRETMLAAWRILVDAPSAADGTPLPHSADISYDQNVKEDRGDYLEMAGLLRNKSEKSELPVAFLYPKDWKGTVVVWLTSSGKQGLFGADGKPVAGVHKLLQSGASVMGVDLIHQGEFGPIEQTPVVKNPRPFAGFTLGYNESVFAQRVHDVLNLLEYVRNHESQPKRVCLVALDETAPIAAVAQMLSDNTVDRTALDTRGFRFASVTSIRSPQLIPGGAKYGDLPGVLAASEPQLLWIAGETGDALKPVITAAGEGKVTAYDGAKEKIGEAAVEWLVK
jgi:dienelactone hydrolase